MAGHIVAEHCGPAQPGASGRKCSHPWKISKTWPQHPLIPQPRSRPQRTCTFFYNKHNINTLYHSNGSRNAAYFTFSAKTGNGNSFDSGCLTLKFVHNMTDSHLMKIRILLKFKKIQKVKNLSNFGRKSYNFDHVKSSVLILSSCGGQVSVQLTSNVFRIPWCHGD